MSLYKNDIVVWPRRILQPKMRFVVGAKADGDWRPYGRKSVRGVLDEAGRCRQVLLLQCVRIADVLQIGPTMRANQEDMAILAGVAGGDAASELAFDRRFRARFELIARCSGVPAQDCEDVAKEGLAAAFSQIRRNIFRGESSLGTWLELIVRGKIIDYKRLRHTHCIPLDGLPPSEPSDGKGNRGHELSSRRPEYEISLTVRQVLHQLPRQHRIVLVMNRVVGLTIDEISQRSGWPPGTVGRVLADAKRRFREILNSPEGFPLVPRLKGSGEDG
jgi:RNA polymerase sigma factor (sigma-70 family)